jgi:hypothetical protein
MEEKKGGPLMETYVLEDVEARSKADPKKFQIAALADRESLRVGDFAKLVFIQKTCHEQGERMWVEVTEVESDHYHGVLANQPLYLTNVEFGDQISFEAKHVVSFGRKETTEREGGHPHGDNIGWTKTGVAKPVCPDCLGRGTIVRKGKPDRPCLACRKSR